MALFSVFAGVVGGVRHTAVMNAAWPAEDRPTVRRKDAIVKRKGGGIFTEKHSGDVGCGYGKKTWMIGVQHLKHRGIQYSHHG